jgi:hypothetical protein
MPFTDKLEDFRTFVLRPIGYLIENSDEDIAIFNNQLLEKYENVVGEARNNFEEYSKAKQSHNLFFTDMSEKISALDRKIFVKTEDGLFYKLLNYHIDENTLAGRYLIEIFSTIQDLKKKFNFYTESKTADFKRHTSIPSFNVKDPKILNDAYEQLTNFGFIPEGNKKTFVDIFTGRVTKEPIIWLDSIESLSYFIKGVLRSENILKIKNREHWLVVQKCFKSDDGKIYETKQLRTSHPPADTTNLDKIIQTFNSGISE